MFNLSNMGDYLLDLMPVMDNPVDNTVLRYAYYCDKIFQNHECLINRPKTALSEEDAVIYDRFDNVRVSIEMMYGRLKTLFPIFGGSKRLRIMNKGAEMVRLVMFGFFTLNCHTCMNGNAATTMFEIPPPTIEQYLPLDEELEMAPLTAFPDEDEIEHGEVDDDDLSYVLYDDDLDDDPDADADMDDHI